MLFEFAFFDKSFGRFFALAAKVNALFLDIQVVSVVLEKFRVVFKASAIVRAKALSKGVCNKGKQESERFFSLLVLSFFHHFHLVYRVAVHSFDFIVAQLVLRLVPDNRQTPEQVKYIAADSYLV